MAGFMQPIAVAGFDDWRAAARELIVRRVPPESVQWTAPGGGGDLFGAVAGPAPAPGAADQPAASVNQGAACVAAASVSAAPALPAPRVPRELMDLLQRAACYRADDRWAFLYKILWRWQQGQREVMSMADEDGSRLHGMARAVRREEHDMHAYLRFRERPAGEGEPRFVAWFEPAHDVLPQVARHFAERMGRTTWLIATPDATVLWDGAALHTTGPLAHGAADIEDEGEALWLTYYRSIFNPARLNPDVMHSHVRSRFWKNMPEGALVPDMVSQAAAGARRVGQASAVGRRSGTTIPIAAEKAQPERQQPHTLDECRRCELWEHATQAVPGEGAKKARIMLVGEQPGDQEDLQGHPFVGPAGTLLDRALAQAGIERSKVYVTNAVKHFKWEPRGKRRLHKTPAQKEILACHYWLEGELEHVAPQVVVALGSTALKAVLEDSHAALKDYMDQPVQHAGRWVVATYHPAYVLRVPGADEKARALAAMVAALRAAAKIAYE
ncbi:DNA polymerase [Massilia sp. Root418]|jgi:DNA polymerase|nr:DNA polymerase [Massilia sp. Root418]